MPAYTPSQTLTILARVDKFLKSWPICKII